MPSARPRVCTFLLAVALAATAVGCDVSAPDAPATVVVTPPEGFGPVPVPPQNPLRASRVALGERLFFDRRLSRDGSVSCATCHRPELAFSDGRAQSVGVDGRVGLRNAPSLLNVAYRRSLFWDGGALFLEGQALVPLEEHSEMDLPVEAALARLQADAEVVARFAEAFDGAGPSVQTLTYAIAAYERTLVSAPTAFDRHRAGDASALPADARRGLALFEQHCQSCHAGAMLTTDAFENNGVAVTDADAGRARVTFSDSDRGVFRVPSLRGVARTAPYFHDGRLATLDAVVAYYDRGGDASPGQSPRVRPLGLSPSERDALVAFLRSLDDQPARPALSP